MPRKNKLSTFLIILIVTLSSCSVYQPMTTDIPLIHKKNDLRVEAGASLIPAFTATASYGLSDKFSVQAFGNIGIGDYKKDDFYFQAAGGYYQKYDNDNVFEWYNGFGYGEGNTGRHHDPDAYLEGNYQLYFTQINYGKIATGGSNLEYGISLKTGYLHTNMLGTNFWSLQEPGEPSVLYKDENLLFEPIGMIRAGGDHLKVSLKMGFSYIYKFTNRSNSLPIDYFNLNLGLNYKL